MGKTRINGNDLPKYKAFRTEMERQYLEDLLQVVQRNIPQACKVSGISRSRLYEMMAKHEISPKNR